MLLNRLAKSSHVLQGMNMLAKFAKKTINTNEIPNVNYSLNFSYPTNGNCKR